MQVVLVQLKLDTYCLANLLPVVDGNFEFIGLSKVKEMLLCSEHSTFFPLSTSPQKMVECLNKKLPVVSSYEGKVMYIDQDNWRFL